MMTLPPAVAAVEGGMASGHSSPSVVSQPVSPSGSPPVPCLNGQGAEETPRVGGGGAEDLLPAAVVVAAAAAAPAAVGGREEGGDSTLESRHDYGPTAEGSVGGWDRWGPDDMPPLNLGRLGTEHVEGADSDYAQTQGSSHRSSVGADWIRMEGDDSSGGRHAPMAVMADSDVYVIKNTQQSDGSTVVFTRRAGSGTPRERRAEGERNSVVTTKQIKGWTRVMVTERPRLSRSGKPPAATPSPRHPLGAATRWGLLPSRLRLGAPHGLAAVDRKYEEPPVMHGPSSPSSRGEMMSGSRTAREPHGRSSLNNVGGSITARHVTSGGRSHQQHPGWSPHDAKGGGHLSARGGADRWGGQSGWRRGDGQLSAARAEIEQRNYEQGNDLFSGQFPFPIGGRWGSRANALVPSAFVDRKALYDPDGSDKRLKTAMVRRSKASLLAPPDELWSTNRLPQADSFGFNSLVLDGITPEKRTNRQFLLTEFERSTSFGQLLC